jgi:hypothetical protein
VVSDTAEALVVKELENGVTVFPSRSVKPEALTVYVWLVARGNVGGVVKGGVGVKVMVRPLALSATTPETAGLRVRELPFTVSGSIGALN